MPSVIKCIVQGKRIEEVLRVLKPYALEPPVVEVIDNSPTSPAQSSNSGIAKATLEYVANLAKKGVKTITTQQLKEFGLNFGGTDSSYSYPLKLMLANKQLKHTKDRKTYEIVR